MSSTTFSAKVKQIIGENFDQSISLYQAFEDKHRFFSALSLKLAEYIGINHGTSVLDVGCGYGLSAKALNERFGCRVVGLDLSPKMIAAGKTLYDLPGIQLVVGDGEKLSDAIGSQSFDYVLYNASIFLFPDVERTIRASYQSLCKGGKIGFSFYPQVVGQKNEDLLDVAFGILGRRPPKFRVITTYTKAAAALRQCYGNIRHHQWERPLDIEFLQDFFSIPAQSASLFPGLEFEARRRLVRRLFEALDGYSNIGRIIWRMAEATRQC